jgi:FkbM family methyltransferase
MESTLGTRLRAAIPAFVVRGIDRLSEFLDPHASKSYSQEGEDLILDRVFGGRRTGFYVDVGAHHPVRFSNTLLMYRRGWRGINIDPDPDAMDLFVQLRPRDINLSVGIADQAGVLTLHRFNEPALNTFDAALAAQREKLPGYHPRDPIQISVRRLDEVLAQHLPPGQVIDVLSVDAEGYDYKVLASNDWSRFRPRFALVEALDCSLESISGTMLHALLSGQRYELFAKTVNTVLYRDRGVV